MGAYTRLATWGPGRPPRERGVAGALRDAVLPAGHAPAASSSPSGLGWFPTYGMYTVGATYNGYADQLPTPVAPRLPLATVALGLIGQYSIVMRSSIVETLGEEYMTTARAKGISDDRDPSPSRPAQCDAPDGHPDRDQPRLRRRRGDHRRGRLQLAWASARLRSTPSPRAITRFCRASSSSCPSRSSSANLIADLGYQFSRPAGQGMTTPAIAQDGTVVRRPRAQSLPCRGRPAARSCGIGAARSVSASWSSSPSWRSSRPSWSARCRPRPTRPGRRLAPPQPGYPLGTDELGRSMLNLTVHGARISMIIGLLATLVTVVPRSRHRDRRRVRRRPDRRGPDADHRLLPGHPDVRPGPHPRACHRRRCSAPRARSSGSGSPCS